MRDSRYALLLLNTMLKYANFSLSKAALERNQSSDCPAFQDSVNIFYATLILVQVR
jgi:hypothetical protein